MSKAFDTINIHTLIRKLLQTNIPGTIIKFIANYIKGRKAYTTYRNHTSKHQFKTGVPQGSVLSSTLFNVYTSDLPPPSAPVQVMAYADDITITSTHTSTNAAKKYIQPYLHKVLRLDKTKQPLTKSRQNNLHSVHTRPCRIYEQSGPSKKNKALPMATHPKVLGLTLDPKLTYSTHIHNISVQAHTPLQIIKALTATGWKQKETPMATYKAVMRPAQELASSVWSNIASSTSINNLQIMQNAALRTATGCTQGAHIQRMHDERLTLPIHEHLQLHASNYKQKTQHPSHPLHKYTTYFNTPTPRLKTLFLTTAVTQQTFPQTPTQSLQHT